MTSKSRRSKYKGVKWCETKYKHARDVVELYVYGEKYRFGPSFDLPGSMRRVAKKSRREKTVVIFLNEYPVGDLSE